jgi:hypothetical protein
VQGFLITLALFTLLVTPFCWAICRASVAGWIIWGSFMIALIVVLLTLAQTTRLQLSPELLPMTLLNNANLAWVIVSSYSDSLREFRAPVATLVVCLRRPRRPRRPRAALGLARDAKPRMHTMAAHLDVCGAGALQGDLA